jgi:acyl carrier protein
MSEVKDRIDKVIRSVIELEPHRVIKEKDDFYVDLEFDSLEATEFIIGLEEEFGITIQDKAAENMRCVKDAIALVTELTPITKSELERILESIDG